MTFCNNRLLDILPSQKTIPPISTYTKPRKSKQQDNLNALYKLLIHKRVFEVPHELYLSKLFVNMAMVLVFSIGAQMVLTYLGLFHNPGPVPYALLAALFSLVLNKVTGNIAFSSNLMLLGGIIVIFLIVEESGGIYSYTLRWLICVQVVSYLFSNNERKSILVPIIFTGISMGVVVLFYFFSRSQDDKMLQDALTMGAVDYMIDNIIFIITLSALAYLIQRVQNYLIAEYQDKNNRLETANEELERFAFIASHDLKEPVRNICSFSQLALKRLEQGDTEGAKDFLQFVAANSSQMNNLITSTLQMMSIEQQPQEEIDLNIIMNQVKSLMEEQYPDRKYMINVPFALPVVKGSSSELLTCIKQLVTNGLVFNNSAFPEITIQSTKSDDEYVISVLDNGKGIEPQYLDRIFSMYTRLESRSVYSGSGLGLSICKKLIERWNGRIWVESKVGKGSEFYFTVPRLA